MERTRRGSADLTEGALLPKIILFALPLIATGILQMLFNTADTMVVGRWGGDTAEEREIALAAVGSCTSLINLIINLFFGLSVGAGVCAAQDLGAKNHEGVRSVVHTAVSTALVCGVAVAGVGILLARPLLAMMGTDPSVLDAAVPYMIAYFCGAPANMVYNYCAAILRADGDTFHPMVFLSVGGVANVGLNLIMVLAFDLGAIGVGIATAASHWVACALVLRFMCRLEGPCKLEPKQLHINREKLRKIIYIGVPAGLQGMVFSVSNVLIQSSINSFGKATVAANTASSNICDYIYTAQNALHHAALNFVGQNLGARRIDRIAPTVLCCCGVVTVLGLTMGGLILLFGPSLIALFSPGNPEVVEIGMIRIRIIALTYFLCGLMEVGSGVLRGLGRSFTSMLVSITGGCVLRILWIYTVFAAFRSLECLYISYPVTWIATLLTHFSFAFFILRRMRKKEEPRTAFSS